MKTKNKIIIPIVVLISLLVMLVVSIQLPFTLIGALQITYDHTLASENNIFGDKAYIGWNDINYIEQNGVKYLVGGEGVEFDCYGGRVVFEGTTSASCTADTRKTCGTLNNYRDTFDKYYPNTNSGFTLLCGHYDVEGGKDWENEDYVYITKSFEGTWKTVECLSDIDCLNTVQAFFIADEPNIEYGEDENIGTTCENHICVAPEKSDIVEEITSINWLWWIFGAIGLGIIVLSILLIYLWRTKK